jgi:hypothetical protein
MRKRRCANCGTSFDYKLGRCPECATHGSADEPARSASYAMGYKLCEWEASGERCRFPGTMSNATNGSGPWFCQAHFFCHNGGDGARIVDASRTYRHETIPERIARYHREADVRHAGKPAKTPEQVRADMIELEARFG